jgi:membrane fusion protein (multidrug efflux system)
MNTETPAPAPDEKPAAPLIQKTEATSEPVPKSTLPRKSFVRPVIIVVACVVLIVLGQWIVHSFRTVSTDDAYVNSYVAFVAPRVTGQVAQVLVEDNNRVKKGDVLVQLDPEPNQVKLAIKQAALDKAQADYAVAEANKREMRSRWTRRFPQRCPISKTLPAQTSIAHCFQ